MDRDYELQTHQAEDRHWWYRGRRSVLERVIDDLRLPARARILDAGCGSGRNMVEFARHGTVTGIELSDDERRRSRASAAPARWSKARCSRCPSRPTRSTWPRRWT